MSKIMLVEDDNNLREIYEARLLAEGYEIVSAHDGEEALALAVKEKPDLIISDVMMPKISGFDMLDILRSTPETRDTKVIMMTALSQAEDKERADKLGADRYLVKSQVTLEDVAKIAREVLEGTGAAGAAPSPSIEEAVPAAAPIDPAPVVYPTPVVVSAPVAAEPVSAPPTASEPVAVPATVVPVADDTTPVEPIISVVTPPVAQPNPVIPVTSTLDSVEDAQSVSDEQSTVNEQVQEFVNQNPGTDITPDPVAPVAAPVSGIAPSTDVPANEPSGNVNGKKVLQPISDPGSKPDLNKLLEEEQLKSSHVGNMIAPQELAVSPQDDPNLIAL